MENNSRLIQQEGTKDLSKSRNFRQIRKYTIKDALESKTFIDIIEEFDNLFQREGTAAKTFCEEFKVDYDRQYVSFKAHFV